ncbi:hypothetical protein [Hydrogenimonas thermophila]|uniref:Uncharacterized protein n=1 Tax=Hydrogenimonas thermophila TaxID=223786 RepID=A0A1I5SHD3_9BACT|nr:hypothetical protein [Hydrogenimonas thermophila]SFP70160.1 hypothetical protein SAMN05216234_1346 [Hydrogenimonas thermophila]
MCLLYTKVKNYQQHSWKKREKNLKKHIAFNKELMKPDVNFKDERIEKRENNKEKSLFFQFLDLFK